MRSLPWPSARDYCEAIADRNSLSSLKLRSGTLELGSGGLPKAYAGTFTTTFRFKSVRGDLALRCFTRGNDDLGQRYAAIGELLQFARIDALCQTQYIPEGIRVAGIAWPTVVMDWVPGLALNAEIDNRHGDGDAMLALAMEFRDVVRSLRALGIAHGDLQHANILVSNGRLRLIDYDGMYLPALADLPQLEHGQRNYQHPARRSAPFDSRLDRFSSIVIYTALIALSVDRSLWTRFNDGENLLFRAHDFTSNGDSDLFRTLLANNATSALADVLLSACRMPVEQVPTLEQAIQTAAGTMPAGSRISSGSESVWRLPHTELLLPPRHDARTPEMRSPASPKRPQARSRAATLPRSIARHVIRSQRLVRGVGLVIVVTGLAIGFAIAAWRHGLLAPMARSQPVTVAAMPSPVIVREAAVPGPAATVKARPAATPVATVAPRAAPAAAALATAFATARATPTPTFTAVPTARVSPLARVADSRLQGAWQISEANLLVGTIVWSGDAVLSDAGTIVLDTHKANVAGQSATPCERRTNLHTAITLGVPRQIVRYRETNCQGAISSGEIRVTSFAQDARSFLGSFWRDGVRLGDFTASKQ